MREVVFRLNAERLGHLEAQAECLPIRITAPTLEELQLVAREAIDDAAAPVLPSAASVRWSALEPSAADLGCPSQRPPPSPAQSPARSCWPGRSRRQPGRLAPCLQQKADATGALIQGASVGDPPRQEPFGTEAWLLDPEGNRLLQLVLPCGLGQA